MAFYNLLFAKVDNIETELKNSQQEIASNYKLNERLKNILEKPQILSTSILRL